MYSKQGTPKKNDLVLCTIKVVQPSSIFVALDEYKNLDGMIPTSEVPVRWLRRLKTYLKVNGKLVCKVIHVDDRGQLTLSIRRVGEGQRDAKIKEWNNEKKANDMLEIFGKQNKISVKEVFSDIGEKILAQYGPLYPVFVEVAREGEKILQEFDIKSPLSKKFADFISQRIAVPTASINGIVYLQSRSLDGVSVIQKTIAAMLDTAKSKNAELSIVYAGAPKYQFKLTATDQKAAERALEAVSEAAKQVLAKDNGLFELKRGK